MPSKACQFDIKNDLAELARLTEKIEAFGRQQSLNKEVVYTIRLVLDEIVSNIILYGYEDEKEHLIRIDIRLCRNDESVSIDIRDDGKPFNPLEVKKPDTCKPLHERKIGGLGVFLVCQLIDEIDYWFEKGYNRLKLLLHLESKPDIIS